MSSFGLKADAALRETLKGYSSQRITRSKPQLLFREGQPSHGFYLIIHGSVRLYIECPSGKKALEREAGEGCVVGLPATVSGREYSLTCEIAETTVELAYLSLTDFSRLMKKEPEAAMKLLYLLSAEVQAVRSELAHSPRAGTAGNSAVTN